MVNNKALWTKTVTLSAVIDFFKSYKINQKFGFLALQLSLLEVVEA